MSQSHHLGAGAHLHRGQPLVGRGALDAWAEKSGFTSEVYRTGMSSTFSERSRCGPSIRAIIRNKLAALQLLLAYFHRVANPGRCGEERDK